MARRGATGKRTEAMVRIGTVMGIPSVIRQLGHIPGKVLAQGGFDEELFDDPDTLIPLAARGRLMEHCATSTDCEHFGLLVGEQVGLHSLGLVGLLAKYSSNVGTALNNVVSFFHLHVQGASISVEAHQGSAFLGYQLHRSGTAGQHQSCDGAIAILFNIMRELSGDSWKPQEVWLMHKEPKNTEPFKRFFRARLRFNAEQYAVVFHSSWLTRALPEVHADERRLVQKQIDALAARHDDNFPQQVRTVLHSALLSGHAQAEQVATLFSMHPRTLNRHLRDYGIGYQQLVDEVRFDIARQMLSDSKLEVNDIALILHYADARSFIRAFRRWSGTTPARWRATQKQLRRALST